MRPRSLRVLDHRGPTLTLKYAGSVSGVAVRILSWEPLGLIVRGRRAGTVTLTYGEILTAERSRQPWRLVLHTRGHGEVTVWCGRRQRVTVEDELRRRGVRVVDSWGLILSPTLDDFVDELDREPVRVRQSSDSD